MSSVKTIVIVVLVAILLGVALFLGVQHVGQPNESRASVAGSLSGQLAENYDPYLRNNGGYNSALPIKTTSDLTVSGNASIAGTATFSGVTVNNAAVYGIGPNGATTEISISTAATTSMTLTPAQFCSLNAVTAPSSNTTTVTLIFPSAAATAAVCGGLPAGAWGAVLYDNESTSSLNLATTTGSNLTFQIATGSAAFMYTYPPKVPAQTLAQGMNFATGTNAFVQMIEAYGPGTSF